MPLCYPTRHRECECHLAVFTKVYTTQRIDTCEIDTKRQPRRRLCVMKRLFARYNSFAYSSAFPGDYNAVCSLCCRHTMRQSLPPSRIVWEPFSHSSQFQPQQTQFRRQSRVEGANRHRIGNSRSVGRRQTPTRGIIQKREA